MKYKFKKNKVKAIFLVLLMVLSFSSVLAVEPEVSTENFNFNIGDQTSWEEFRENLFISFHALLGPGFASLGQEYSTNLFAYIVRSWQPPTGGDHCESINDFEFPFGEYQCKSLGTDCIIINSESEGEQKCIHDNPDDSLPPLITPSEKVKKENYRYIKTGSEWPEEYGYRMAYEPDREGCIPPFTEVVVGINTSEHAQCKFSQNRTVPGLHPDKYFEEIGELMEGNLFLKEHIVTLPAAGFPSLEAFDGSRFELVPSKEYDFFMRCQDRNGNFNKAAFSVEFCIQDKPDITPPNITRTTAPLNGVVSFNVSTYPLDVFTNEPADCRWAFEDVTYDQMAITGTNMTSCSETIDDLVGFGEFGCRTTLTGIKPTEQTNYFIRCKDKPWLDNSLWLDENVPIGQRYANDDSYVVNLMSTGQLIINSITVNGEDNNSKLVDSVDPLTVYLEVQTLAGANEGNSKCEYSIDGNYVDGFFDEGDPTTYKPNHIQRLDLSEGEYTYGIKCRDEANNIATGEIYFQVDLDEEEPIITRVYEEGGNLKIKTNEDARCVFSLDNCNFIFSEGAEMVTSDGFNHFTSWNTEFDLFIKCEDLFGNKPTEGCTIEVRAFEEETI